MSETQQSTMSDDQVPTCAEQNVGAFQLSESFSETLDTADAPCHSRLPSAQVSKSQAQNDSGSGDEDHQATQLDLVSHAFQASEATHSPRSKEKTKRFNEAVNRYTLNCLCSNILTLISCGAIDRAELEALKALEICTNAKYDVGIARCKFWLGRIEFDRKNWKGAYQFFLEAMPCIGKCREGDDIPNFLKISNPTKTDKERFLLARKRNGDLNRASCRLSASPQPKPVKIHHEQRQNNEWIDVDEQDLFVRGGRDSRNTPCLPHPIKALREKHLNFLKRYGESFDDAELIATGHRVSSIMGMRRISTQWGGQVYCKRHIVQSTQGDILDTRPSIERHSSTRRDRSKTARRTTGTPDAQQRPGPMQQYEFTFQCDLSGCTTFSSPQPPAGWKAVEKRVKSRKLTRAAWLREKDSLRKQVLMREFYRSNGIRN